jgi:hypothetical protein
MLLFFLSLVGAGSIHAQIISEDVQDPTKVLVRVTSTRAKKKNLQYTIELLNDGPRSIIYASNPQQAFGAFGPYISLDQRDKTVVEIQSRVFPREIVQAILTYSNQTRVELKRLEPGKTAKETVSIKWPLSETVPPNPSTVYRKIDRKDVKKFRFSIGYFEAEDGLVDFLKRKPFGWFIKGNELLETGVYQGKFTSEIQKLASLEVIIPD